MPQYEGRVPPLVQAASVFASELRKRGLSVCLTRGAKLVVTCDTDLHGVNLICVLGVEGGSSRIEVVNGKVVNIRGFHPDACKGEALDIELVARSVSSAFDGMRSLRMFASKYSMIEMRCGGMCIEVSSYDDYLEGRVDVMRIRDAANPGLDIVYEKWRAWWKLALHADSAESMNRFSSRILSHIKSMGRIIAPSVYGRLWEAVLDAYGRGGLPRLLDDIAYMLGVRSRGSTVEVRGRHASIRISLRRDPETGERMLHVLAAPIRRSTCTSVYSELVDILARIAAGLFARNMGDYAMLLFG